MRKWIAAAAMASLASGCGGGASPGSSGGNPDEGSSPRDVTGLWRGTTSSGRTAIALTLSNRQMCILYSGVGNSGEIVGAIEGTYTTSGNTLTTVDAIDMNLEGRSASAFVTATATPRADIVGSVSYGSGAVASFSGSFDVTFLSPASLAAVAGTYRGPAVVAVGGDDSATMTVGADGAISGTTANACSFHGTATPDPSANVFNIAIRFSSRPCSNANNEVAGVAYFDAPRGRLYAAAISAERRNGFFLTAARQ